MASNPEFDIAQPAGNCHMSSVPAGWIQNSKMKGWPQIQRECRVSATRSKDCKECAPYRLTSLLSGSLFDLNTRADHCGTVSILVDYRVTCMHASPQSLFGDVSQNYTSRTSGPGMAIPLVLSP